MHRLKMYYLFLFLFILPHAQSQNPDEGWISLFNGKDLEGWVIRCLPEDSGKQYWKVSGGFIECNSMGDPGHNYVWLVSEREFSDFHLKLEFQVFRASPGNSGVQFRSRYDVANETGNGGWLNGPQADIHGPAPWRTGMIYDETKGVQRWIFPSLPDWNITLEQVPSAARNTVLYYNEDDPDRWNNMGIICSGMHVSILVNGNKVTDFNGEGILNDEAHRIWEAGSHGSVALQLHMNDELHIRYRNILIKE
ncbi:MAG: 3-keto-disaccharide hydrolase [Bacteroidales bacterium]